MGRNTNREFTGCDNAYKDLLWRAASATSVKEIEKYRAKSDLLLNNICKVFNGKIGGSRDKPMITLLKYIRKYCMKRIVNVQSVIEKCTGPLTPTTIKIMESIKKEAHLIKVQWNGANKYQVSGSLYDRCIVDVVTMIDRDSLQAQEIEPAVGQDGLGAGIIIGLFAAVG
ncbi:hypothetical protein Tco_1246990 [Tanacetum coccineum]